MRGRVGEREGRREGGIKRGREGEGGQERGRDEEREEQREGGRRGRRKKEDKHKAKKVNYSTLSYPASIEMTLSNISTVATTSAGKKQTVHCKSS